MYDLAMRSICASLLLVPLLMLIGCAPTRTYDVTVRNDLNQPITVWLTKNGPPPEANWLSPEQIAIGENPTDGRWAGSPVAPGKTAETGKIKGKFPNGTDAILRVYVGHRTLDEILAVSARDTALRVDKVLPPGPSNLIVREEGGRLVAVPAPGKL